MTGESYLAELRGEAEVRRIPLPPTAIVRIGRDARNTIVIESGEVSRYHAEVECGPSGAFRLKDLGSRNGTFLNQRPVTTPMALRSGDRIKIGPSEFVFTAPATLAGVPTSPQPETASVNSEQQLITVLVADIRGFTALARDLGEVRLTRMISVFNRECGAAVAGQQAWGHKFIGDAVMALWVHGAGEPDATALLSIFSALSGILDIAASLQNRFQLDAPVTVGAGINTGWASLGNIGSNLAADYSAVSDAVNLSVRLESATRALGCDVAIGEATWRALSRSLSNQPPFTAHQAVLKGYVEPVPLYAASRSVLPDLIGSLRARTG